MTDPITTVSLCSGVAICAGVLVRGAVAAAARGREQRERDQRRRQESEQFGGRVSAVRTRTRAKNPLRRAWSGSRPFRVSAVVDECDDVRSFYLTPQDDQPLPRYQPGQYVTLELPQPGAVRPLVRCYSMSERPRDEHYRITVKRAGRGSSYLFDEAAVGAVLNLRAPAGEFFLDPASREPVALVAGGIGVTPLLAMLDAMLHDQPGREVAFFAGMRNGREHPFRRRLKQAAAEYPTLKLAVCYSQPEATDVAGADYHFAGRLTPKRIRGLLPSSNYTFYVCGSGPMMEQMIPGLEAWGVPPDKIHYEAFGPSSIRRAVPDPVSPAGTTAAVVGESIRLVRSEKEVIRGAVGESILETVEHAGIRLNAGCRAGSCGECAVKLLTGKVKTLKRPGITVADDECLTCISAPAGAVELDA